MGPKVAAAIRFVDAGGREAIVGAYDALETTVAGRAGAHVEAVAAGRANE
jgi:carbamate kinase